MTVPAVIHSNDARNYFGDATQVRTLAGSQGVPGGFGGAQFLHYRAVSYQHDGQIQRRMLGQRGGPAGAAGDMPRGVYPPAHQVGRETPPKV